jgi:hypothetical protein
VHWNTWITSKLGSEDRSTARRDLARKSTIGWRSSPDPQLVDRLHRLNLCFSAAQLHSLAYMRRNLLQLPDAVALLLGVPIVTDDRAVLTACPEVAT